MDLKLKELANSVSPNVQIQLISLNGENTNSNSLSVKVLLSEEVADLQTSHFDVQNATITSLTGSGVNYILTLVPTGEGVTTISFGEPTMPVYSREMPKQILSTPIVINVDQTRPTANITTTAVSPTDATILNYQIVFSEPVQDFDSSDLDVVGSGVISSFSGSGSTYQFQIVPTLTGTISVSLPANSIGDVASNQNFASNVVSVTYDSDLPNLALSIVGPSVAVGKSTAQFEWTLNYTDASSISLSSVTLLGATAGCTASISGSGLLSRTVTVSGCTGNGLIGFSVATGSAEDSYGNQVAAQISSNATVDNIAPTVAISAANVSSANSSATIEWLVTFTEADTITLSSADILVAGNSSGCQKSFSVESTTTRKVSVTGCTGNGNISLNILPGSASDAAGNLSAVAGGGSVMVDNTAPSVTMGALAPSQGRAATTFSINVFFNGATAVSLVASDVVFSGTATTGCTATIGGTGASARTVQVTGCSGDGTVRVSLPAGIASDNAGNLSAAPAAASNLVTLDNTPPVITLSSPSPTTGLRSGTYVFAATLTGGVGNLIFTPAQVIVGGTATGCTVSSIGGGGTNRTINVGGCTGAGTVHVSLPANINTDTAGNGTLAVGPSGAADIIMNLGVNVTPSLAKIDLPLGTETRSFIFTLSETSQVPVTVDYKIMSTHTNAVSLTDHTLENGSVTIPAGQLTAAADFTVRGAAAGTGSKTLQVAIDKISAANTITYSINQVASRLLYDSEEDSLFSSLSSGQSTTCGITTNQKLKCWGGNTFSQVGDGTTTDRLTPVAVDAATDYTHVSSSIGGAHACAVTVAGDVKCWGTSYYGQTGTGTNRTTPTLVNIPGVLFNKVATGDSHTCAISTLGKIYCWGYNNAAQVGNNSTNANVGGVAPVEIDSSETYTHVVAGQAHSCGLTSGGALKCWGAANYNGTSGLVTIPTVVDSGVSYLTLSAGPSHTCGITSANKLKCWGLNTFGQLGNGTTSMVVAPTVIDTADYKVVTTGGAFTCGMTIGDKLKCWGQNTSGEYGNGTITLSTSPVEVANSAVYTQLSGGFAHACGLVGQTAHCWGLNRNGQLGNGLKSQYKAPLATGDSFDTIYGGGYGMQYACGIKDGLLKCWGENNTSQLGISSTTGLAAPLAVDPGTTYSQVSLSGSSSGTSHVCGVTSAGGIKCWGSSSHGQLGDGTSVAKSYPINVAGGDTYTKVSVGSNFTCAINTAQRVKCWGMNSSGQLGLGNTTTGPLIPTLTVDTTLYTDIVSSANATCGITVNGDLKCWGGSANGEMGGAGSSSNPVAVDSGTKYKSIVAGTLFFCGIIQNDTVRCWGGNNDGQLGRGFVSGPATPGAITGGGLKFKTLGAKARHACGITETDALYCWGWNNSGQVGNNDINNSNATSPALIDSGVSYLSVAPGENFTCALTLSKQRKCWGDNLQGGYGMGGYIARPTFVRP